MTTFREFLAKHAGDRQYRAVAVGHGILLGILLVAVGEYDELFFWLTGITTGLTGSWPAHFCLFMWLAWAIGTWWRLFFPGFLLVDLLAYRALRTRSETWATIWSRIVIWGIVMLLCAEVVSFICILRGL